MSDIKAGDLVIVVKPNACCGDTTGIGAIFTVPLVETCISTCKKCGRYFAFGALVFEAGDDDGGWPTDRLKRIDSPAEGDSLPTHRDLWVTT